MNPMGLQIPTHFTKNNKNSFQHDESKTTMNSDMDNNIQSSIPIQTPNQKNLDINTDHLLILPKCQMPPTDLANPTFMFTWCTIKEQAKVTPMLSQGPTSELPHQKMITNQALLLKIEE